MIVRLDTPDAARAWCADVRLRPATEPGVDGRGNALGFVPTMGALHEGHLTLVERARAENEYVCASVFVNPLQFDDPTDYERYPRDLDRDVSLLARAGCDMVFTGTLADFFPNEIRADGTLDPRAMRVPGPAAEGLEGAFRAGHFAGVATIVARLFAVVRPTRAYFGAKDYQQTLVVRDLARSLGFPAIVVCPTAREPSGLARSSRNQLLDRSQREDALAIVQALRAARSAWRRGERDADALRAALLSVLESSKLRLEYAALRDPERWTRDEPRGPLARAVALVAARAGSVRLIDNMRLDDTEPEAGS